MVDKLKSELEVNEMLRTKILAERESFFQEGMLLEMQYILIDQLTIKFGASEKVDKRIKSVHDAKKLTSALKKFVTATSREEVLRCLD